MSTKEVSVTGFKTVMAEHIESLLSENFIRHVWVSTEDECDAWSDDYDSYVKIVRPIDRGSYLSDLHQIGHHLSDWGSDENPFKAEVHAWTWAFDNSKVNITSLSLTVVDEALWALIRNKKIADAFATTLKIKAENTNRIDRL